MLWKSKLPLYLLGKGNHYVKEIEIIGELNTAKFLQAQPFISRTIETYALYIKNYITKSSWKFPSGIWKFVDSSSD